ncbi:MAG: hypothetical protein KDE27_24190 [Planctomycetes bacterium]|nr:hypothetical protein [Planctomycetota bacterium]
MALLMIALIVAGFGGRALARGETSPPAPAILIPHAICIGAWYLLFLLQAAWIGRRRLRLHRAIGYASPLLAVAVLWTGVAIMAANYRLKGNAPLVFFNALNLTQFAGLFSAAIATVRRPAVHKRLMLYASIAMLPPALVRLVQALGLPDATAVLPIIALWLPGPCHDRRTLGRVHGATWIGIGVIAFGVVIGGPIGFSTGWAELVERWFGTGS